MDLARPYSAVSPTLEGDVLAALSGTTRPLTGRDVARLVRRGSQRGVQSALDRLVEHGLVDRQEAGRALLYTLNREHLAAPAVEVLAVMRNELVERLQHTLQSWGLPPEHASLFGSAARGDGDTASDVDLFVVRPAEISETDRRWREQLDRLATDVRRWTGNHLSVAEIPAQGIPSLREEAPRVVGELRSDALTLIGPEVPAFLGPEQ